MRARSLLPLSVSLVAVLLAACGGNAPAPSAAPAIQLQVYAASSLKKVLTAAAQQYAAASAGVTLVVSTDASSALETKIEQGAPADLFLSADTKNPQELVDAGLVAGGITDFARNTLTVIVPAGNPAGITTPADLARPGVKVIACGDDVPIARYTATLLANLSREPGYPADFASRVGANVVSREDNAGAIVAKVGLGEGDAGVVYLTDAAAATTVTSVAIPDHANVPATYGGVVLTASANGAAAKAFLAWLAGPDGQAILSAAGFLAVEP